MWRLDEQDRLRERFNGLADRLASFGPFEEKNYQVELISGVYIPETPCGMDIDEMLNRANMARKSIVSPRGSRILFFTEELRKKALAGIEMEAEMRSALDKEEFVLYLQPQIKLTDVSGQKAHRAEALVRLDEERKNLCHAG